ncbi:MAG: type VII secretion-associated protein [Mycobacterium sp.]
MGSDPSVVLEVGPAVVRRLDADIAVPASMVAAALDGIDDPLVLIGERPVRVDDLLRSLIAQALGSRCSSVKLVHPSSWPAPRVARVVRAAAASADRVVAVPRRAVVGPGAVIIEIDSEVVTVCAGGGLTVLGRDHATEVADTAARYAAGGDIVVDIPPGLLGAAGTATAIRAALACRGLIAEDAGTAIGGAEVRRRITLPAVLIGACAIPGLALAVGVASHPGAPAPASAPSEILSVMVEGRVAVAVPEGWTVERITGGPGSRRVRVSSPGHPDDSLHITGSYVPGTTLADAGEVLGRAVAGRSEFGEFRADDDVDGRPAVTYREDRPPRVIRWTVLLDGSTRIAVGCQSRPGAEDGIRQACEQAIRSARELPGTTARP